MKWLKKYREITEGWKNLAFENPEVEKIAKDRATICADCPFSSIGLCTKCGCPLKAKTRSLQSKCPEGKW